MCLQYEIYKTILKRYICLNPKIINFSRISKLEYEILN